MYGDSIKVFFLHNHPVCVIYHNLDNSVMLLLVYDRSDHIVVIADTLYVSGFTKVNVHFTLYKDCDLDMLPFRHL